MPFEVAVNKSNIYYNRRNFLLGAGAMVALSAAPVYSKATGYVKGAGQYRRLTMFNGQTSENIDIIYWIDGVPILEATSEINWFMRDWREDVSFEMQRDNFYHISAVHNLLETNEPIQLLSGYRTKKTNDHLRRKSRSVSRNSYHLKGMAADIRVKGRRVSQIAKAAQACSFGGIGQYSSSNFIHLDCADVRVWGS